MKIDSDSLLLLDDASSLSDEEFLLLYDMNKSNLTVHYWNYRKFDLDSFENDQCVSEFRFEKKDVYILAETLEIAESIICYNGTKVDGIESLCIYLKRFAYLCRYSDMISRFWSPVPELCLVSNNVMKFVCDRLGDFLKIMNPHWLVPVIFQLFSDTIHESRSPSDNCWGLIDGTIPPICRPRKDQYILYNGYKKVHAIKFQSVVVPNGLIANLYDPAEGRRHGSSMLGDSGLFRDLRQHVHRPSNNILCLYGNPGYLLRPQLMGPFQGGAKTPLQNSWIKAMSQLRVSVEWIFVDILDYFKFLDFKMWIKLQLSAVGKMLLVCALMQNARTCMYGNETASYFDLKPVTIEDYFVKHWRAVFFISQSQPEKAQNYAKVVWRGFSSLKFL